MQLMASCALTNSQVSSSIFYSIPFPISQSRLQFQKGLLVTSSLTNNVDQHIPLSTIIRGVGEQELHQSSFHWLLLLSCFHKGI